MLIDQIEYIKVLRKLDRLKLEIIEEIREMKLYDTHLQTKFHRFDRQQVLDLTYKAMHKAQYMIFIHTDHSVYSYVTHQAPESFIENTKRTFQIGYK